MKTLAEQNVLKFLMAEKGGVISTVSDDQAHAAFVYYIADEDLSIYFATVVNSRKHDYITANSKVAFTVASVNPPQTVQLEGIAEIVVDPEMIKAVTANYYDIATENNHYDVPITKLDTSNGLVIYRIKPTWLRWSDFTERREGHDVMMTIIG